VLLSHICACLGLYVRSHKRDPLLGLTVPSNIAIGAAVWVLGSRYGALAAGIGLLAVLVAWTVPGTTWIWMRCRTAWHAQDGDAAGAEPR
jgi:hypothetical protein